MSKNIHIFAYKYIRIYLYYNIHTYAPGIGHTTGGFVWIMALGISGKSL